MFALRTVPALPRLRLPLRGAPSLVRRVASVPDPRQQQQQPVQQPKHDQLQQQEQPQRPQRRERVLNLPNLLSLSRICATPVLGFLVVDGHYSAALGLFVAAGVTDLLDGWIARTWDQRTVFGAALDPFADKLLMTTLTLSTWAAGAAPPCRLAPLMRGTLPLGLLSPPVALLIVTRDAGMIVAGFYLRYASLPPPKTLSRYFDIKLPSVDLRPSNLSKWNTALQLTLLASVLAARVFGFEGHLALRGLESLVIATTVASGMDYIVNARRYVVFVKPRGPS
eukprot:Unigene7226_Nuclearia_a/m.22185 Unigene7226_Nuclearia_a/g.22185  ORF Unigene7226_Nuclearia_a/g.22185 Unigene7226_Nuclearia_a/m.22185 type:complete len:281 (-) Unigene7226_Nuclearia_a:60-902(-)